MRRHHRQGVGHGDKVESAVGVDSIALPLGKNEGGRVLKEALDVLESTSLEPLARDLEEGRAQVEDVDGVEVGDGEVLHARKSA